MEPAQRLIQNVNLIDGTGTPANRPGVPILCDAASGSPVLSQEIVPRARGGQPMGSQGAD